MKKVTKKPGRKPLKKVRAQKRRGSTMAATKELMVRLGTNPFHLNGSKHLTATKALARVIQHFQKEYFATVDKYSKDVSSEPLTRQSVISALQLELSRKTST